MFIAKTMCLLLSKKEIYTDQRCPQRNLIFIKNFLVLSLESGKPVVARLQKPSNYQMVSGYYHLVTGYYHLVIVGKIVDNLWITLWITFAGVQSWHGFDADLELWITCG